MMSDTLAAVRTDPLLALEDEFFAATDTLATIRQAARARLVSPWAVAGAVLARVLAETPPHIVLPPVIGGDASLNLAFALVAPSGAGKSGAKSCADDLFGPKCPLQAATIGPGTGEGIMQSFLWWDSDLKRNVLCSDPWAILYADEVGQIGAIQARSGATFGPIIRSMLTGGEVSTTNAEESRRRHLRAHTYRLTIVSGVQPRLSDVLLADQDAGTPQRWVWLPATDPHMPDEAPDWPGALEWRPPPLPLAHDGRKRLEIPADVATLIRATHRARQRGEGDPLDGHRLLTQEKVAAGIALLHRQAKVTTESWRLASILMAVSDQTRAACERALADRDEQGRRALGRGDVLREMGAREARAEQATRLARSLWRTVTTGSHSNAKHGPGEGCTRRCLTFTLRHHREIDPDSVIATAVDMEWIEERRGRWWPGVSQPADD